jgi:hypothetical protein
LTSGRGSGSNESAPYGLEWEGILFTIENVLLLLGLWLMAIWFGVLAICLLLRQIAGDLRQIRAIAGVALMVIGAQLPTPGGDQTPSESPEQTKPT